MDSSDDDEQESNNGKKLNHNQTEGELIEKTEKKLFFSFKRHWQKKFWYF
jgi:hypothetical protein